jgi:hypothetical protein
MACVSEVMDAMHPPADTIKLYLRHDSNTLSFPRDRFHDMLAHLACRYVTSKCICDDFLRCFHGSSVCDESVRSQWTTRESLLFAVPKLSSEEQLCLVVAKTMAGRVEGPARVLSIHYVRRVALCVAHRTRIQFEVHREHGMSRDLFRRVVVTHHFDSGLEADVSRQQLADALAAVMEALARTRTPRSWQRPSATSSSSKQRQSASHPEDDGDRDRVQGTQQ